jgi:catechol 2,3-dioxygenase-like lactoylglutathione lyase family enzyme
MDIRQFRVVIRAKNFDRTSRFYGDVLGLPRLQSWEREDARGALFQVGAGVVEVVGRPRTDAGRGWDEAYDYQGPQHKMELTVVVPSAEKAYESLLMRDQNIPGGLRHLEDGTLVFQTHDPDGVHIVFRQAESAAAARHRDLATPSAHAPAQEHGGWAGDHDWGDRGRT